MHQLNKFSRIIGPTGQYNIDNDHRFLIPFLQGTKIGFINHLGQVVIAPRFEIVLDDFLYASSLVRVGTYSSKVWDSKKCSTSVHKKYGVINSKGEFILDMCYESIRLATNTEIENKVFTVYSQENGYAVLNDTGKEIIPFGRYNYIGGFSMGFARVKIGSNGRLNKPNDRWGIINNQGKEMTETCFINIPSFYNQYSQFIVLEGNKGNKEFNFENGTLHYEGYHKDEWLNELEIYEGYQQWYNDEDRFWPYDEINDI